MTDDERQALLDALIAQHRCYQQMVSMNRDGSAALAGDTGQLAQFAADKSRLMGEVEAHEQVLATFKRRWPSSSRPGWLPCGPRSKR